MNSTLIPERPLLISPTLAATIGLEETVMLHVLGELIAMQHALAEPGAEQQRWVELDLEQLQRVLPFWAPIDIRRIQSNLRELGLLKISEGLTQNAQRFEIDDGVKAAQTTKSTPATAFATAQNPEDGSNVVGSKTATPRQGLPVYGYSANTPAPHAQSNGGATLIPANWQPEATWIKQCQQHNIPEDFLRDAVPEFVQYWRDRGQARFSWGNAFYKHVLKLWREEQTRRGAFEQASEMSASWRPSPQALSILHNAGVNPHFIEDAIPEFVLYWEERGASSGPWNTRFIEHIRRQWARYTAMQGFDDTPRPIPANWSPSADFYETLQLAEIDADFANARVAEFVLYWRDSQQAKASWNTTFLQFVKAEWARKLERDAQQPSRGMSTRGGQNAENRRDGSAGTSSVAERLRQLDDRSWAS